MLRDSEAAQRSLIHHAAECGSDDSGGVKAMGRASCFSNPGWTVIGAVLEIASCEFREIRRRPRPSNDWGRYVRGRRRRTEPSVAELRTV